MKNEYVIVNAEGAFYTGELWAGSALFSPDRDKAIQMNDEEVGIELTAAYMPANVEQRPAF